MLRFQKKISKNWERASLGERNKEKKMKDKNTALGGQLGNYKGSKRMHECL